MVFTRLYRVGGLFCLLFPTHSGRNTELGEIESLRFLYNGFCFKLVGNGKTMSSTSLLLLVLGLEFVFRFACQFLSGIGFVKEQLKK